ncbi:MAG: patatin-like phospholipase family protein, partial [Gemmatimonadaceae bacterium]
MPSPSRLRAAAVTVLLACAIDVSPLDAALSQAVCAPARTALVLAGGGAKGAAHIGVIRVLDSLGIHPD